MVAPTGDRDDTLALVADVSRRVSQRLPEVTRGMRTSLGDAIAELVGDHRLVDLLSRAIEGNVATFLAMLREHTPLHDMEVPAAAVVHARRLAQQGVPVFAMVRAYRLGQAYLLDECFAELSRDAPDPARSLAAYNRINVSMMSYIDWVSQEVVTAYEIERDQWVRTQDVVRTARIREIVSGRRATDVVEAEVMLRYRLGQHHVAAVLWSEEDTTPGSLGRLEAATVALSSVLSPHLRPLAVAADRSTTWAWFPRGNDDTDPDLEAADTALRSANVGDVRLSLGGAVAGVDGFRESHRQAEEAGQVLRAGGHTARRSIGYREPGVAAAAILAQDIEKVRTFVAATLGPLAADDAAAERLRDTLLGFLECGSSYTATAQRHALHKNSVKYRVERALELRGRPLADDRVDVELTLIACKWLTTARSSG